MAQSEGSEGRQRIKRARIGHCLETTEPNWKVQILGPNLTLRTLVLAHFDGEGNINEVDHVVLNGTPPAAQDEWRPSTGTYTINPDCTGSAA